MEHVQHATGAGFDMRVVTTMDLEDLRATKPYESIMISLESLRHRTKSFCSCFDCDLYQKPWPFSITFELGQPLVIF
jgi:hypothetical protein